jgi:5-methylcytosine-specific restriction endonuclease McrA
MPEIRPYEAAIYIHLLRHSIIETGNQYVRVSRRGLQDGVIKSAYAGSTSGGKISESTAASFKTVQNTLEALVQIGALREEGAANRQGTLYRVMLPEEIEVCRRRRDVIAAPLTSLAASQRDADFYNVRENRVKIWERDAYQCKYCGDQLTRFTATLDHVRSVRDGGDNSFDNLITACLKCNSKKNHQLLGDFIAATNK